MEKEEGNYKDGKKDGKWVSYWGNGKVEIEGNYKDGKKDGLQEFFNMDGSLNGTETWKNGKLVLKKNIFHHIQIYQAYLRYIGHGKM